MLTPVTAHLTIYQGATFRWSRRWLTGETAETAVPVDLSGYTARMQVREGFYQPVLLELTTTNGGIVLNSSPGTIALYISATDTAGFTWEGGMYQMELVNGTEVIRIFTGKVKVIPEVTK